MRKKVSTLLEEGLYRRAKLEAALRGKQVSEILGEALEKYLDEETGAGRSLGVVEETWGSVTVRREVLEAIMADEDWIDA